MCNAFSGQSSRASLAARCGGKRRSCLNSCAVGQSLPPADLACKSYHVDLVAPDEWRDQSRTILPLSRMTLSKSRALGQILQTGLLPNLINDRLDPERV